MLVEYVSANPTGPLHVGHGRGAAVGQALSPVCSRRSGIEVVSEYYINDAGRQMKLLGASVTARYRELWASPLAFRKTGITAPTLRRWRSASHAALDAERRPVGRASSRSAAATLAYQELLSLIREDLKSFGIEFDSWFSEASLLSLTGRRASAWTN